MKKIQAKSSVVVLAIIMVLATVSVQAQAPCGPQNDQMGQEQMHRGPHGPQRKEPPRLPGLTEEQKGQMKDIHVATEKATLPVKNQIREKEARLRTLVTAETYDEGAINQLLNEIGELKVQVEKTKIASLQQIKEVLNDEQLLVFYKHMDKKTQGAGPGQGKGPRGRGR